MAKLKDIDEKKVEMLAAKFWNYVEIAAFFSVDEATIRRRFADIVAKGKASGRGRLKDAQLAKALEGNPTMLIWLGKQHLGQTEKIEVTNDNLIEEELEFVGMPKGKVNGKYKRFYN